MATYNIAVDNYIAKQAEFAKPILEHFRELMHATCVDLEEKMKWSMPFFDYKGEMMCHIAAFKNHATIGFWKASLIQDSVLQYDENSDSSMGGLGKLTSLKDLPSDKKIISLIKKAMQLNDDGIKVVKKQVTKKELIIPDYFTKAVSKNKKAVSVFEAFSYSCKKEYVQWITEAKTEATKDKRLAQAIEMMAEGKTRNWKYK
jgi:uncharacterized protein YdeI (YjbR/CyaY-like superfamily)